MTDINDFLPLMPLTIKVEPFLSRDKYGVAQYDEPVYYQARVNYKSNFIRGKDGEVVPSRGQMWVGTAELITVKDRLILPDGSEPQLLDVNGETDENGTILYRRIDLG